MFAVLSVLSAILCVTTAGWWWRQFLQPSGAHAIWLVPGRPQPPIYVRPPNFWVYWRGVLWSADPGAVHLGYVAEFLPGTSLDPHASYRDWGAGSTCSGLPYVGVVGGCLAISNRTDVDLPRWLCADPCGVTVGDFGRGTRAVMVDVPYPAIVILSLAFTLLWVVRSDRQFRRRRRPLVAMCLACGYDLRASPDTCPECGEPARPPPGPRTYALRDVRRIVLPRRASAAADAENVSRT